MPFRLVLSLLAISSATYAAENFPKDRFGGRADIPLQATGFFRTQMVEGKWWYVTPEGHPFLSFGVNVLNPVGDTELGTGRHPYQENVLAKYGSVDGWIEATRKRYADWGLNTIGNWSGEEFRKEIPYTFELGLAGRWGPESVPDFFDPAVQASIRKRASDVAQYCDDPMLIGYYLDNELPWGMDWHLYPDLFPGYTAMPADAPGKKALVRFFRESYVDFTAFTKVWGTDATDWSELAQVKRLEPKAADAAKADMDEFVYRAAREYFRIAAKAIREKDPNHLILGCRFVWVLAPRPVVRACGEYCDVVSVNFYDIGTAGAVLLQLSGGMTRRVQTSFDMEDFYRITQKPLMITEFSFRGEDSGLPNSFPPGLITQRVVPTQKDRADRFERCARTWMSKPYFLGYHWFQWMDEPFAGRAGDGENGNYGLVNIHDEPWQELADRMREMNRAAWGLHAGP